MLELSQIDGYRIGSYQKDELSFEIPGLLELKRDSIVLGNSSLHKPLSYPFRDMIEDKDNFQPLLRVSKGTPLSMAQKIQKKNVDLKGSGDIVQVFLSGMGKLDDEMVDGLDASIYLFDMDDERSLLKAYFRIREKNPEAVCFCNCGPDELPVLAYAGFDLFTKTDENQKALELFLENDTPQYVEMTACSSIRAKTLLDLLYNEHWGDMAQNIHRPIGKELYISKDAFWRPNAQRWAKNVCENFIPQSKFFLLLPCSSRKPYSSSPSHRRFITMARSVLGRSYGSLCQLIVTSPYGVVPRDLEGLIDYDIVVTGKWMREEVERSSHMLKNIISKTKDPQVIAHLPENELDTLEGLEGDITVTTDGHPLSDGSMQNLKEALLKVKDSLPVAEDGYGDVRRLSKFLYGKDIFPDKIYVKGRGVKQVFSSNVPLASLVNGLRPLSGNVDVEKKWVEIDFDIKGDLFCVGVRDADEDILAGDEVIIRNGKKTVAVGTAILPGKMMKKMRKGKAVKIRKRFH